MNWYGKRVLVTGAAGFIGSHLLERLVEVGAEVSAFVRYNSRGDLGLLRFLPMELSKEIQVISGDLKDPMAVSKAVSRQEVVFHLAALIGIPYSYVHPVDYVQTNILGTTFVLEACLAEGVERVIHTSTSEVYGTAQYTPIDESHPLQGQSPYAASKIGSDQLALSYHRSFGLPVSVIRPFNTFGPRQSSRAVIPTIITQALSAGQVHLGSTSPTRDFTFVADTVEGFLKIGSSEESLGTDINIGSGSEISIWDLAMKIFDLLGRTPVIATDEARVRPEKSEVQCLLAGTEKARRLLNWRPSVSLEQGLQRTIAWIEDHRDLYTVADYHV